MLEHHIQKAIVYRLAFSPALKFSQLKPDDLESKLFDYHLKLVIKAGLAQKNADGLYSLTSKGKRVGVGAINKQFAELDRAHSVVFLIVRRASDNAWLLFKRQTHPLIGEVGLPHVNPQVNKDVMAAAQDTLCEITGLQASFTYYGNGYFKVLNGSEIESFTHFTVLACNNAIGDLTYESSKGEYFWQTGIAAVKDQLLPTAWVIIERYQAGDQGFFIDQTFNL